MLRKDSSLSTEQTRMMPAAPLQQVSVMVLNLSCPAVSQICNLSLLSSTCTYLTLKSTPMVATWQSLNCPSSPSSAQNLEMILVLPTPESPTIIILTIQSQTSRSRLFPLSSFSFTASYTRRFTRNSLRIRFLFLNYSSPAVNIRIMEVYTLKRSFWLDFGLLFRSLHVDIQLDWTVVRPLHLPHDVAPYHPLHAVFGQEEEVQPAAKSWEIVIVLAADGHVPPRVRPHIPMQLPVHIHKTQIEQLRESLPLGCSAGRLQHDVLPRMRVQLGRRNVQIPHNHYGFLRKTCLQPADVTAKSDIVLLAVLESFELLARGGRVDVDQHEFLELERQDSPLLTELPLGHVLRHRFGQKFRKNGHPRIPGGIFGEIPVPVVAVDVDGRLIVRLLIHLGLSYADDVRLQLVDVRVEQLLGEDRPQTVDVPVADDQFGGGSAFAVVPAVQTRLDVCWNHVDQLGVEHLGP